MSDKKLQVILSSLGLLVAVLASWLFLPVSLQGVPTTLATGEVFTHEHHGTGYVLYVPTSASPEQPITLLVALYGMGGNAEGFAASLAPIAEENGWMLVVPQFNYGDWTRIEAVRSDDRQQLPWLRSLLDVLPQETGLQVRERVLIYGFSRGAQAAHRFALMYPNSVLASAVMSAGTHTLPLDCAPASENHRPLEYPLGISDLSNYCGEPFDVEGVQKVAFWVGVGALDNRPEDVPRQWDAYAGSNRVDRARAFARSLSDLGARADLEVIPHLGHGESAESRERAVSFLREAEAAYLVEDRAWFTARARWDGYGPDGRQTSLHTVAPAASPAEDR